MRFLGLDIQEEVKEIHERRSTGLAWSVVPRKISPSAEVVVVSGVLERVQQVSFIGNILRITSCKQNQPRIDALR